MFYRRYEISKTLNGSQVLYIARDAVGIVRFRETTEKKLKKAIDEFVEEKQKQVKQTAKNAKGKKKTSKSTKAKKKEPEEGPQEEEPEEEEESIDKKKSFWDKL
jgi:hypothetical protein